MKSCSISGKKGGKRMATHKIGKLKFRFNDGALEYRWADGEVRRLGKKQNEQYQDEYTDSYAKDYEDEETFEPDYGDDYAPDNYGDYDDYGDEDYGESYDDVYGSDAYADDGYADDYADDGYADDGYAYDDDGYDDEYDDRYSDVDADDGYYDAGYEENGYPDGNLGMILQYVDENDWVTYLLLFLLPPLGIYLLWRRQRFDQTMRYALSAASGVWFIVLCILLIMTIFGGGEDKPGDLPQLPSATPTIEASVSPSPTVSPSISPSATAGSLLSITPSATPIGGTTASTSSNLVWCSASGSLYHNTNTCSAIESGESVSQVTLDNAKSRNKYECPVCYGGEVYYATAGGRWYHKNKNCNMTNATVYSKEQAEATGKTACPVCVTGEKTSLNNASLAFITTNTTDKSGIKVWYTSGGSNYHMTKNCRGMSGASQHTLKDALIDGKTACSTCCAASGTLVYCTSGGKNYHTTANCRGMSGAKQVTVAEALVLGKTACDTCKPVGHSDSSSSSSNSTTTSNEYYVYASTGGKYYHLDEHCGGMTKAQKVTLKSMLEEGRPACPTCCSGADMTVYAAVGGTYYHSYATCTDMKNAVQGTLANALAMGYHRCPKCWGDSSGSTATDGEGTSSDGSQADSLKLWATADGKYYHTKQYCTGMKNAVQVTLREAVDAGKSACPTCCAAAETIVYSNTNGKYYHKASTCTNMDGAKRRTLAEALLLNQTACPVCMASDSSSGSDTGNEGGNETTPESGESGDGSFTVGKSGVKVYGVTGGEYYHIKSSCGGSSTGTKMALETALNNGMVACQECASVADTVVYGTPNGKYYHLSKSCAGSGAQASTFAYALAWGFKACPYCVSTTTTGSSTDTDSNGNSNTYTLGTSGVNVYATVDGKYYHSSQSCAPSNAVQVTLETALNYGKSACPDCCAVANRTVYATANGKYYHASKSCAGSNAVSGTFAQALAYGLKACPNCVDVSDSDQENEYSAPYSTTVYVDLYSDEFYYHKSSSCSSCGMSGGTGVTLQFVKDLGYVKCPYCNPPSDIS